MRGSMSSPPSIILVTARSAKESPKYPFAIINYISLLGEAMGIEYPDVYKRFKLKANPDAVFSEVEAYVRANRLIPA